MTEAERAAAELELLELEEEEYQASQANAGAPAQAAAPEERSALRKGLSALDYDRAMTTGPAFAGLLEEISGKDVLRPEEVEKAAKLQADYPSSADLLERAGYLKDWPKTREGLGFALDIGMAPSTYATLGGAALAKAGGKAGQIAAKALTPVESLTRALGKMSWKSAFKALDTEALKQGSKKVAPSKVLMDEGVAAWTARGLNEKMAEAANKLDSIRQAILDEATAAGKKINIEDVIGPAREMAEKYGRLGIDQADEVASKIRTEISSLVDRLGGKPEVPTTVIERQVPSSFVNEAGDPIMNTVRETIPGRPAVPPASPSQASDVKSFLYKGVPSSNWSPYTNTPVGNELTQTLARGLRQATENVAPKIGPVNERLGSLLSTRKKQVGEVAKQEMRDLFTSVDAMNLQALGASNSHPAWWLLKKAADIAKLQGPRSQFGRALTLGASPISTTARRGTWSLFRENPNGQEN